MTIDTVEKVTSANSVMTPAGINASLHTADEIRASPGEFSPVLVEIADWCENFLGRPSGLVGRTGNVCPFVPEALMRSSLKFAVVPLENRGIAAMTEIEQIVVSFREYFLAKEKAEGKIDIFGSIVMIFPQITREEAEFVIDVVQRDLKPTFVKEGLMLGEFHPTSRSPGLRNPIFRPLRSPIPLLVIRHMVESDIDFLMRPFDPAPIRVQSLTAYLQFLGSSLSLASQVKARKALKIAEAELA